MRYTIEVTKLDKNHPHMPNKEVYRILDTKTGIVSQSYYLSLDRVTEIVLKKNGGM